ncbi:MAG: hypothetical protein GY758_33950, partial [Fuerstiella sp.]|nr:hypothetical protein [Fuerstiella sp.]
MRRSGGHRTPAGTKHREVEKAVVARKAAVTAAGAELQNDMRKHMKGLGFNILILPENQSRTELLLSGMTATMPESYVDRLAESEIVTVNHLLPSVTRRMVWPEYNQEIVLIGTRGEVPILHRGLKGPLLEEVAAGNMVVGFEIQKQLNVGVGDSVQFCEKEFTISRVHPERGSTDDVTIWIGLKEAQEL